MSPSKKARAEAAKRYVVKPNLKRTKEWEDDEDAYGDFVVNDGPGRIIWNAIDLFKLRMISNGRLEFRDANFGVTGFFCLMGAAKNIRILQSVHLRNCRLNDASGDAIVRMCMATRLREIILSGNALGDRFMEKMAQYVDHSSSVDLKLLQIDKNLVEVEPYRGLARCILAIFQKYAICSFLAYPF